MINIRDIEAQNNTLPLVEFQCTLVGTDWLLVDQMTLLKVIKYLANRCEEVEEKLKSVNVK